MYYGPPSTSGSPGLQPQEGRHLSNSIFSLERITDSTAYESDLTADSIAQYLIHSLNPETIPPRKSPTGLEQAKQCIYFCIYHNSRKLTSSGNPQRLGKDSFFSGLILSASFFPASLIIR